MQVYLFSSCRTINDITTSNLGIIPRSDSTHNTVSYVDIIGSQVTVDTTPYVDITAHPHSALMLSCSRGEESVSRTDGYLNQIAEQLRKGERDLHTMHRNAAAWIKSEQASSSKDLQSTTPEWRENLVRGSLLLPPTTVSQQ